MKLLITEANDLAKEALAILSSIFEVVINDQESLSGFENDLHQFDAVFIRLEYVWNSRLLDKAPSLKYIITPTTGLNHIDLDECKKRNVQVLSLKGQTQFLSKVSATAELTWTLILSLVRKLPWAFDHVKNGKWNRDKYKGRELADKTLGIIGLGRLGRIVARYANAFNMNVIAYDINQVEPSSDARLVDMDYLLEYADIISLHIPYDKTTHHFIKQSHFKKMKPGVIFINTSRGEVVNTTDFIEAFDSKIISLAGLDVLEGETSNQKEWPEKETLINRAKESERVIITPHIGGATYESMHKTEIFMANQIKNYLQQK